jgi:hypothetical protein
MNRQLTSDELELTNKGIDRVTNQKTEYQKGLDNSLKYLEFLKQKRDFEDYVRPFNREKEDKDLKTTIDGYTSEIKMCDEKLEVMNNQLNDGVEVKEPPIGV